MTPNRSPALPFWRLILTTGGRCMVAMSVGNTRTVSISCACNKHCARLMRGCIRGTPSSFVASWQVDSIKVSHHHATDLGSPRTWWTNAFSCRSNRWKAVKTKVQIVAVRRELTAISLRVAQEWPGWVRIHATSRGTMHHRDQCPIVLSPQPQAAHTVPLVGKVLLNAVINVSGGSIVLSGPVERSCKTHLVPLVTAIQMDNVGEGWFHEQQCNVHTWLQCKPHTGWRFYCIRHYFTSKSHPNFLLHRTIGIICRV